MKYANLNSRMLGGSLNMAINNMYEIFVPWDGYTFIETNTEDELKTNSGQRIQVLVTGESLETRQTIAGETYYEKIFAINVNKITSRLRNLTTGTISIFFNYPNSDRYPDSMKPHIKFNGLDAMYQIHSINIVNDHSINIEYIVTTRTQVNDHLTKFADKVNRYKIRLNTITSPLSNKIDHQMLIFLFNIRGTLTKYLNQINDLIESHKYAWEEKIKRIGKTSYDALSEREKKKLNEINELTPRIH